MIQVGSTLPEVDFGLLVNGEVTNPGTNELFSDKRVVLFAVPGAFTPTCSQAHLPGYVALADKIKAKGIDSIICLSVNDAFVMDAWGRDQGVGSKIVMLADGNGEYAKALDLEMDGTAFGMGMRGKRFAIVVDDGTATHVAVEDPGQFEVSKAESILEAL